MFTVRKHCNLQAICCTFIRLSKAITEAYTPSPRVQHVDEVFDIKGWPSPHLQTIHGHSAPLCFKFCRNEDGKAEMAYRHWSTDSWSEDRPILLNVHNILKSAVHNQILSTATVLWCVTLRAYLKMNQNCASVLLKGKTWTLSRVILTDGRSGFH